jgi:hypothetical protein
MDKRFIATDYTYFHHPANEKSTIDEPPVEGPNVAERRYTADETRTLAIS